MKKLIETIRNIYKIEELRKLLIKSAFRMKKAKQPDYMPEPEKKGILTSDFLTFLYNARNRKSWFIHYVNNKPEHFGKMEARKIAESIPEKDREPIEKFYRKSFNELRYWKRMKEMYDWWNKNHEILKWQNINNSFDVYFNNWRRYMEHYTNYFSKWKDLNINNLGIDNTSWHKFIDYVNEKYGYELFPNETKADHYRNYPEDAKELEI